MEHCSASRENGSHMSAQIGGGKRSEKDWRQSSQFLMPPRSMVSAIGSPGLGFDSLDAVSGAIAHGLPHALASEQVLTHHYMKLQSLARVQGFWRLPISYRPDYCTVHLLVPDRNIVQ